MLKESLKNNTFERKIYNLCDGKTTILEISKKMGKSPEYIGSVLSRLRKKKQIQMMIDDKTSKKMPTKRL